MPMAMVSWPHCTHPLNRSTNGANVPAYLRQESFGSKGLVRLHEGMWISPGSLVRDFTLGIVKGVVLGSKCKHCERAHENPLARHDTSLHALASHGADPLLGLQRDSDMGLSCCLATCCLPWRSKHAPCKTLCWV